MLTPQRLREILHYDPETGVFTWAARPAACAKIGSVAGWLNTNGYWRIMIDYRPHNAHRLAWLYVHGEWPKHLIDHIDGNRLNNAIANLRDVTVSVNQQNRQRANRDSKTGFFGVSPCRGKFRAKIVINNKSIHLGAFKTPELAHAAYLNAKRLHHEGNTI